MPHKIRSIKNKKLSNDPISMLQRGDFLLESYLRYKNILFIIVGLVISGVIAGTVFWQFSVRNERQAWALEGEAFRLFHEDPRLKATMEKKEIEDEEEHFRKALDLFRKIVQEYPRTTAAPVAQFYIGNAQFELKESDSAVQSYQTFINEYGDTSSLMPLVQAKLAYAYQQTGKEPEALKIFQTVMGNDLAFNQDQAYYEVGRIYEAMDVKTEAIAAYEKASEKFEDSPWAAEAQARLALLSPEPAQPSSEQTGSTSDTPPSPATIQSTGTEAPMIGIEKDSEGNMTVVPITPGKISSPPDAPMATETTETDAE